MFCLQLGILNQPQFLQGYTGNIGNAGKWPTHFIELEPDGNGSANIVWEWHI